MNMVFHSISSLFQCDILTEYFRSSEKCTTALARILHVYASSDAQPLAMTVPLLYLTIPESQKIRTQKPAIESVFAFVYRREPE